MAKMYYHTYRVTGRGRFPVDMLRYDASYPRTEEGSGDVMRSAEDPKADPSEVEGNEILRPRRTVELTHLGPKNWFPTVGRWESFGWSVAPAHRVEEAHV
jgi:hypothetical protein